jgi:adenine deaminase
MRNPHVAPHADSLTQVIRVARGDAPADLLITGGQLVNVASGEVYGANVAVVGDTIAAIGPDYREGHTVIDAGGRFVLPGLIDAHMHLESSLLTPSEFARTVLPHGTTAIVIDPHEIANVLGMAGIRYILESSRDIPLSLFVMASSCVPATDMETAGATLGEKEIRELLGWERVIGLAEMMNVPAVLGAAPLAMGMLAAARERGVPVDGHAPGLSGPDVVAYAAAGIRSDHECTTAAEGLEKLRLGMYLMIREGSAAKNMEALLPVVTDGNYRRCLLVSDDTHPHDLIEYGHIDHALRKAVALGLDPVRAVQMVTINAAEAFGRKDLGAVLPGYKADVVLVDDLKDFRVETVVRHGRPVVLGGRLGVEIPRRSDPAVYKSIRTGPVTAASFSMPLKGRRARVIGLTEDQIVTRSLVETVKVRDGCAISDPGRDILKLAVIERHHATGNVGLGLVKGFGLKRGAMGSSVAHDSHNLVVVGTNDADMALCVRALTEMGGGFAVVVDGRVEARLALPVAGLMSEDPAEEVAARDRELREVAARLGVRPKAPFITLSFLALPVIPELKLTDRGLVDVARFRLTGLAA